MRKLKNRKNRNRTPIPKFLSTSSTHTSVATTDETHYSWDMVRGLLLYFHIPEQEFNDWITGQTCPILLNGECGYFAYDVYRFIGWKRGGSVPIWD